MDGHKEHRRQRKNHAVQHIETQQRVGIDRIAAEQQEVNLLAHDRNG